MLAKRIIPCLDVKNGETVKGTNFVNLRSAGDPVELGHAYSDAGADELVVLDSEGNRVEFTKCTSKENRGVVTFTATWDVTGSVGEVMSYTVIVYDSDGARSVNTETVNVTVKKGWSL